MNLIIITTSTIKLITGQAKYLFYLCYFHIVLHQNNLFYSHACPMFCELLRLFSATIAFSMATKNVNKTWEDGQRFVSFILNFDLKFTIIELTSDELIVYYL